MSTTITPVKTIAALLPMALCFLLSGCGGGGSNGGASTPSAPAPVLSASAVTSSGLTATLAENTASVPINATVTYTLTLTNNTSQPITFYPDMGCTVIAGNVGGRMTIQQPTGQSVPLPESTCSQPDTFGPAVTLAPGQSMSEAIPVTSGFSLFTSAGHYAATAEIVLSATATSAAQSTTVGPLALTVQ